MKNKKIIINQNKKQKRARSYSLKKNYIKKSNISLKNKKIKFKLKRNVFE